MFKNTFLMFIELENRNKSITALTIANEIINKTNSCRSKQEIINKIKPYIELLNGEIIFEEELTEERYEEYQEEELPFAEITIDLSLKKLNFYCVFDMFEEEDFIEIYGEHEFEYLPSLGKHEIDGYIDFNCIPNLIDRIKEISATNVGFLNDEIIFVIRK